MTANVLCARDTNAQMKTTSSPAPLEKSQPKSMEYHRQILQSRMENGQTQQYVSPSDEITSPATKKLQDFKNKHAMKKSKPQTLFKKSSAKKLEAAKGTAMFEDIPKKKEDA